jgi:hypothetical protein
LGQSAALGTDAQGRTHEIRLLVHRNAEVYRDLNEVKLVMDHTDDLTYEQVVDTLIADLRARDVRVDAAAVMFDVNVHAPLELAQAVTPAMVEAGED